MTDEAKFDQRLSRLEATVEGIASSVNTLINRDRVNWSVIFAGLAVCVTIIGAIGYLGVARPQQQMQDALNSLANEYRHHTNNGHPFTVQSEIKLRNDAVMNKLASINGRIDDLKASIDVKTAERYTRSQAVYDNAHLQKQIDDIKSSSDK